MRKEASLYRRFRRLFIAAITVILAGYLALTANLYTAGLEDAMEIALLLDGADFEDRFLNDPTTPLPDQKHLKGYLGWDTLPTEIQRMFPKEKHSDREMMDHRLDSPSDLDSMAFLIPYPLPNTDDKLYLYSRFNPDDHMRKDGDQTFILVASFGLVTLILVIWLAYRTADYLLKPIQTLEKMAQRLDQNQQIEQLPEAIRNDEIGSVAKQLQASMSRIQAYHQRERQFLQNASHELRTPIAVTSSALDIIEQRKRRGQQNIDSSLDQIRGANQDMSLLTQTLLCMAREPDMNSTRTTIDLKETVQALIEKHRYLLSGDDREISVSSQETATACVEPTLCQIVLANLIRNAFEHSLEGPISICIENGTVRIKNLDSYRSTSQTENLQNRGFGLGLEIAYRISEREGWRLERLQDDPQYVEFVIGFS